ncbi:MAG TPA: hypothetical protein VJA19_06360 [Pseudomonas sp.]|nr:hypothetical protein [Pseudomonas sp.]
MPTPNGTTPYSDIALSNTLSIDSLVYGSKWGGALGTGVSLSYSFLSNDSLFANNYSSDNEYANSYQLSANQKTAITSALGSWSAVANIDFALINDSTTSAGDLRFGGYAGMGDQAAAWA